MKSRFHPRINEMARNLRHLYKRETTAADVALGSVWYDDAHTIMCEWSETYGYSIAVCAAITAALSPQLPWTRNLIIADDILAHRVPSIGALRVNVTKAQMLRDMRNWDTRAVFKSGPKVFNFSRNLSGDYSAVTVDTHALQAALCDVEVVLGLKESAYAAFETAYQQAAQTFGIEPAIFQAIIWHTWKRTYPPALKRNRRRQWDAVGEL